jgi:hypothetical protein
MNLIKRRKNLYKFVRVDSAGRKGEDTDTEDTGPRLNN